MLLGKELQDVQLLEKSLQLIQHMNVSWKDELVQMLNEVYTQQGMYQKAVDVFKKRDKKAISKDLKFFDPQKQM